MGIEPKKLDLFAEGPSSVPPVIDDTATADVTKAKAPSKMLFDSMTPEETTEAFAYLVKQAIANGKALAPKVAATVASMQMNDDSSLNAQATAEKEDSILNKIARGLLDACNTLTKEAGIEQSLNNYADNEAAVPDRKEVYVHFMYDGVCVGDFSGFEGDKLPLPTAEDLSEFFKDSVMKQDLNRFVGWDTNGIAQDSNDVNAVLRTERTLTVVIDKTQSILGTIKTYDGAKTLSALTNCCESLGLLTPLLVHYAIYAKSKTVDGDTVVRIIPKTKEAIEKLGEVATATVTVIFALRPSDLGLDTQNLSREEINSLIIQKMSVPIGGSVEPPSDDVLQQHGLRLPFEQYYRWSNSLTDIQTNCVIKALPLTAEEYSANFVQEAKEMELNDWIEEGKKFVHTAWKAIKYPAIAMLEHKLVKEFEAGRKLRTSDFVFRKHNSELMLMKYVGVSDVIEIPAKVNGMYVKYVHPKAFSDGPFRPWHVFNKNKLFSTERLGAASTSINRIVLPRTIKYLPAYFLHGLSGVTTLVVPESVGEMSPNALSGSSIETIYFNGNCPKGFVKADTDADVFVHKKNYKTFFE